MDALNVFNFSQKDNTGRPQHLEDTAALQREQGGYHLTLRGHDI